MQKNSLLLPVAALDVSNSDKTCY